MRAGGLAGAAVAVLAALPALAEPGLQGARYLCARDVEVPVVYVNDTDFAGAVVLTVEGTQVLLYAEPAASGVRYAWPSDGASYVWWTKGPEATLYWREGGQEQPVLTDCREQG